MQVVNSIKDAQKDVPARTRKLVSDETTDLRRIIEEARLERFLIGRTKTIHKTLDPVWVEHTQCDEAADASSSAHVPVRRGKLGKGRRRSSVFAQEAGSTITPETRTRGESKGSAAPTRRKIIEESIGYSLKKQLTRMQHDSVLHNVTEPWVFNVTAMVRYMLYRCHAPPCSCALSCSCASSYAEGFSHTFDTFAGGDDRHVCLPIPTSAAYSLRE